ncbi:hypothetical protein V8D89_004435 [Ganoderma adspersum]
MAACVPRSPSMLSPLDAISKSRWDEKFDDSLSGNVLAGTEGELGLGPEDPAEAVLCGWDGGRGFMDNVPWATEEDWSEDVPPTPKETQPSPCSHTGFGGEIGNLVVALPPTLTSHGSDTPHTTEVDHRTQPDDEDQEVSFDWDEDTPGIVWYFPWRKEDEEDEPAEVQDEDECEDEDEDEDDNSAKVDSDESDAGSDDDDVEDGEAFCHPVLAGTTSDDDGEEEDVTANGEDFVHILVSGPLVASVNACASPTPPSQWSSHQSEGSVVDEAPTPSLKSRLRQRKRPRFGEGSDDDGDESGNYGEPIHRPRKKTRRALSPPPLGRDTASPSPESETPSAFDPPGRHNEGGMTVYRVCKHPRLPCGFPGCKKILSESDHKSFKEARGHYRKHFKSKGGSWVMGTLVTCNWSGCTGEFTLGDMQCNRHLQEDHFQMRYECPHCEFQTLRHDILKKHLKIHEPSKRRGGRRRGRRRE